MREVLTREKLLRFMEEIGRSASADGRIYLTEGASALLRNWRATTIDIDLKPVPEQDSLLRAIPLLKESLSESIRNEVYRYPAIDPPTFEAAVKKFTG